MRRRRPATISACIHTAILVQRDRRASKALAERWIARVCRDGRSDDTRSIRVYAEDEASAFAEAAALTESDEYIESVVADRGGLD